MAPIPKSDNPELIAEPEFCIDPLIRDYLSPTSDAEYKMFEQSIIDAGGADHPLIVWEETGILVDGHRRYKVCVDNDLPYKIQHKKFDSRVDVHKYMIQTQIGRRNVLDHDRSVLIARYHELVKADLAEGEVAAIVGESVGVSKRTVHRATAYDTAFGKLTERWRDSIKARQINVPQKYIEPLSRLKHDAQEELYDEMLSEGEDVVLRRRFKSGKPKPPQAKVDAKLVRPTAAQIEEELVKTPVLPPDVVSALPDLVDHGVVGHGVKVKRPTPNQIVAMINQCEKLSGPFTRSLGQLFSDHGLGFESRSSGWKRRIDNAIRTIAMTLQDMRDSQ